MCGAASSRAHAAPANEDPEELISTGNKLRRKGEEARAEGYFKRAYQVAHTPRTAAHLGLVELALSEFLRAEAHLTEALEGDDAWVKAHAQVLQSEREKVRKHLLAVEVVGAPQDTTYSASGGPPAGLPRDGVVWLEPGAAELRFEAIGRKAATASVTGKEGERRKVAVDMPSLVAAPAETAQAAAGAEIAQTARPPSSGGAAAVTVATPGAPAEAPTPGRGLRIGGIVAGSAGVVAVSLGAVFLSKGNSKVDHINGARTYDTGDGNYETLQNGGVALLVGGGVAIAGGAALFLLGRREGAMSKETAVSFDAGSGFGLIRCAGTF